MCVSTETTNSSVQSSEVDCLTKMKIRLSFKRTRPQNSIKIWVFLLFLKRGFYTPMSIPFALLNQFLILSN